MAAFSQLAELDKQNRVQRHEEGASGRCTCENPQFDSGQIMPANPMDSPRPMDGSRFEEPEFQRDPCQIRIVVDRQTMDQMP